jgi:hypothetical protein
VFSEVDDPEHDDRQASPPGKILPFTGRAAPDWLMGPADGLGAAQDPFDDSSDEASPETLPQPVLRRPGVPGPVTVPGFVANAEPERAEVEAGKAAEAEVVVAPVRPRRAAPPGIWAPVASSVPALRLVLPAEPEPFEDESFAAPAAHPRGLPGRDEELPRPSPPPPLAALQEPWWVVAIDSLRTSRPVQVGVAVAFAAVVLLAYWAWPRGVGTTSLSELRRNPTQYDGRAVVVRGRVGDDIFAVGAGWAFYLVQGRDTIVTFARSQKPNPHDVITVKGQVSTGFLDGVPRQALFEDTAIAQ